MFETSDEYAEGNAIREQELREIICSLLKDNQIKHDKTCGLTAPGSVCNCRVAQLKEYLS